jgi:Flp pilus assembly pilin Flp
MKLRNLKSSRIGRMIRRILGDEKGAVAMEYVILAVLIAAAIVVAVAVFGKTIVGMFDVAGKGASGQHSEAKTTLDKVQQEQQSGAEQASQYHDSMHK